MTYIVENIDRRTVFVRGLPDAEMDIRNNPNITALLLEVITRRAMLEKKIFRPGWFDTKITADIKGVLYTFASPLHRQCIEWMVKGFSLESRIIEPKLFEFVLPVIQRFSRQSLVEHEIGPKHNSRTNSTLHPLSMQMVLFHFQSLIRQTEGSISSSGVELLREDNRFTEGEW